MQDNILSSSQLEAAVSLLLSGELLIFPTDTVYGLGGNAYSDRVIEKIFLYKKRDRLKPLSICYASFEAAIPDVQINENAKRIAESFFPGAVTLVLKKSKNSRISSLCNALNDTIGIRVPNNITTLKLLNKLPFPLAAPSANRSGFASTSSPEEALESLKYKNLTAIDNGDKKIIGIASTIIDVSVEIPTVLRVGAVSLGKLSEKTGLHFICK